MRMRGGLAGIWCVLALFGIALLLGGAPRTAAASGPEAPSTTPPPLADAGGGVSDTLVWGDNQDNVTTYTLTGVTAGPNDTPAHRSGTVTADTVTLSGTFTYKFVGSSGSTTLVLDVVLNVTGGKFQEYRWPPSGQTVTADPQHNLITAPFELTTAIPTAPSQGAAVSFAVSSKLNRSRSLGRRSG